MVYVSLLSLVLVCVPVIILSLCYADLGPVLLNGVSLASSIHRQCKCQCEVRPTFCFSYTVCMSVFSQSCDVYGAQYLH